MSRPREETRLPRRIPISPAWRGFDAVALPERLEQQRRQQAKTDAARERGDHRNVFTRLRAWVRETF